MKRREIRGMELGESNLLRVMRHDLPGEHQPTVVNRHLLWLIVLIAITATLVAVSTFVR